MQEPDGAHAHVLITGRVQGVGYRAATHAMAQRLSLTGWVRNLVDGRVEAVFAGPKPKVCEAIAWCQTGPRAAIVEDVSVMWHASQAALAFTILPTATSSHAYPPATSHAEQEPSA